MQKLGVCQCRYPPQIEHGVPRGHKNDILLLNWITTAKNVTTEASIQNRRGLQGICTSSYVHRSYIPGSTYTYDEKYVFRHFESLIPKFQENRPKIDCVTGIGVLGPKTRFFK